MRLGIALGRGVDDEILTFGVQLGATDAIGNPACFPEDEDFYEFRSLVNVRKRIEESGLRFWGIENIPTEWYDKVMLGLPGRDQQIENFCKTLRNMGAAGIPVLGYHFMPTSTWRTSEYTPGRGGAKMTSFDYEMVKNAPIGEYGEITDDQLWDNFEYFLKAVVPVAEKSEVMIGLHPDDPPISPIAGVARIFRSHAALKRLIETVSSDYSGLEFCQGTISEMPENVLDAIRYFGSRNKIGYVHFRNVSGPVPNFTETFIDEGHVNMLEAMKVYKKVGLDVPIIDDHVPMIVGDPHENDTSGLQWRAKAYTMGYIKALIDFVEADG